MNKKKKKTPVKWRLFWLYVKNKNTLNSYEFSVKLPFIQKLKIYYEKHFNKQQNN